MVSAAVWVFPVAEKYTTRVRPVSTEAVPALVSSWVVVPSPSEAVVVSLPQAAREGQHQGQQDGSELFHGKISFQ